MFRGLPVVIGKKSTFVLAKKKINLLHAVETASESRSLCSEVS